MKHYHPEDSVVCSVIAIVCTLLSQTCMGHEECVHMAITKSATESSASLTAFLTDNFGASCAPFESVPLLRLSHGPIGWMVQGSFNEDDRPRSIKHFYTVRPQRPPVAGLTDAIPYAETDSFTWGAIRGGGGPIEKQPWSWQNARDYAYAALTSPLESQRFDNFADLFFALGHVLHLCQDLAQPDHVRNDAHPIKKLRWIENHGAANYEKKKGIWLQPHPHGWPYWRSKGFTKLQDFWDRGKYKGDDEQLIAALDKDKTADGDEKLGLAEFCNGNFLGEDATYAEYFTPGDQHYFPFPRVRRMQSFKDYQGNLPANVRMTFVRNGDSVYPSACEGAVWVYFYTPGICNAGPPLDAAVTVQVSGVLGQDTRCGYNSKARAEIEVNFKNNTGFASWKLNGYDGMSPVSYEHTVTATGRIGTGQSWAPTIQLWCDYSTMNATITIRPLTIP